MYKLLITFLFVIITFSLAAEDSYVFEAKGAFAKDLKALVEKYKKDGNIEVTVYKKGDVAMSESKTITQSIISAFSKDTAESLKYADVSKGEKIYTNHCSRCHGKNANSTKYSNARKLSTLKPITIVELLEGYKSNYEGNFGGSTRFIMKPQADKLTSEDMQSIAVYIYSINNSIDIQKTSEKQEEIKDNSSLNNYLQ